MGSTSWLGRIAVSVMAGSLAGCVSTPGREEPLGMIQAAVFCGERTLAVSTSVSEVALFDRSPYWFRAQLTRESDKRKPVAEDIVRSPPIACSPDGTLLVAAGVGGAVVGWDVALRSERFRVPAAERMAGVTFFPDGRSFVTVGPAAQRRDATSGLPVADYADGRSTLATAVAISPDGTTVLVGFANGEIAEYDANSATRVQVVRQHAAPVTSIAFSPDGALFASTAGRFDPHLWSRGDGGLVPRPMSDIAGVGESIGQAERDSQIAMMFVWLIGTARGFQLVGAPTMGTPPMRSPALEYAARQPAKLCEPVIAFSPDGRFLAATANLSMLSGELHLVFADTARKQGRMISGLYGCYVAFAPGGGTMITAGLGNPRFWNIESGVPVEVSAGR